MHPHAYYAFTAELLKIAEEDRPTLSDRATAGIGAAAGTAAAGAAANYAGGHAQRGLVRSVVKNSLKGSHVASPAEMDVLKRYVEGVGGKVHHNIDSFATAIKASPAEREAMRKRYGSGGNAVASGGHIFAPQGAHPSILAHEAGHVMGNQKLRRFVGLVGRGTGYAPGAAIAAGALGAAGAAAGKEENKNRNYRLAQGAAGLGGALAAPRLLEEGRATYNAINIGRKVGKGAEYAKHLLPAWGTYAAKPLAATGATIGALELLRRRANNKAVAPAK